MDSILGSSAKPTRPPSRRTHDVNSPWADTSTVAPPPRNQPAYEPESPWGDDNDRPSSPNRSGKRCQAWNQPATSLWANEDEHGASRASSRSSNRSSSSQSTLGSRSQSGRNALLTSPFGQDEHIRVRKEKLRIERLRSQEVMSTTQSPFGREQDMPTRPKPRRTMQPQRVPRSPFSSHNERERHPVHNDREQSRNKPKSRYETIMSAPPPWEVSKAPANYDQNLVEGVDYLTPEPPYPKDEGMEPVIRGTPGGMDRAHATQREMGLKLGQKGRPLPNRKQSTHGRPSSRSSSSSFSSCASSHASSSYRSSRSHTFIRTPVYFL